ncbi:MAG: DUF1338 domain-containing protein [Bacteroidales bacterium]|jgi:hypothetical protein|nr:DUF1338 domain-containing protein [Bacteroidales bacterium]
MKLQVLSDRLWNDFITRNPSTKKVYDLFRLEGETVVNDHIAFRTFNHPSIGIDQIAMVFLRNNYVLMGEYRFEKKKLFAKHYEHKTDKNAPRIFISELILDSFSFYLQQVIRGWINSFPEKRVYSDDIIYSGNLSGAPSYTVYEKLRHESEYAAWLYVHGFCANHYTVSVNHLKKFNSIQKVNDFVKSNGFLLNDTGGEIQGSPVDLLEQSSIKAGMIKVKFTEGKFEVPGCFYEFARRYPDNDGKLYNGFITKSADNIFDATNFYKK